MINSIRESIAKRIIGKDKVIDEVLICLICGGHGLIEDVPGLGKTTLISALAKSTSCSFQRVQFTPDVLPSDITGYNMFHMHTGETVFHKGAVMNQILLADEINRTGPKTQSALLQAMQENQVTVDNETHDLPKPFLVFATQNPIEMTGTFPLPEAQLDRFLLRISVGYPKREDEIDILESSSSQFADDDLSHVCTAEDVTELQKVLDEVRSVREIKEYIVSIAEATRKHNDITLGLSPRGSIALLRASMGRALLSGRSYVIPDDVQQMAVPVIAHRLVLDASAVILETSPDSIVKKIVDALPVPGID